jgi:hypothetical protein
VRQASGVFFSWAIVTAGLERIVCLVNVRVRAVLVVRRQITGHDGLRILSTGPGLATALDYEMEFYKILESLGGKRSRQNCQKWRSIISRAWPCQLVYNASEYDFTVVFPLRCLHRVR